MGWNVWGGMAVLELKMFPEKAIIVNARARAETAKKDVEEVQGASQVGHR